MGIHDRQRRPRWVDSLFNLKQLIRLATTQDNKRQKSQRKREKGEGGVFRYFSSSHKGLLVWVTPASWRTGSVSPALLSSLRFWTALHRCASDQKCRPLLQPSRRAPFKSAHTKKIFSPPGCHSLCGQETEANQRSPYIRANPVIGRGRDEKLRESFTPTVVALWILLDGVRCFQRRGSEREKQSATETNDQQRHDILLFSLQSSKFTACQLISSNRLITKMLWECKIHNVVALCREWVWCLFLRIGECAHVRYLRSVLHKYLCFSNRINFICTAHFKKQTKPKCWTNHTSISTTGKDE